LLALNVEVQGQQFAGFCVLQVLFILVFIVALCSVAYRQHPKKS
jgi:hypothetical protein